MKWNGLPMNDLYAFSNKTHSISCTRLLIAVRSVLFFFFRFAQNHAFVKWPNMFPMCFVKINPQMARFYCTVARSIYSIVECVCASNRFTFAAAANHWMNEFQFRIHIRLYTCTRARTHQMESITICASSFIVKCIEILRNCGIERIHAALIRCSFGKNGNYLNGNIHECNLNIKQSCEFEKGCVHHQVTQFLTRYHHKRF